MYRWIFCNVTSSIICRVNFQKIMWGIKTAASGTACIHSVPGNFYLQFNCNLISKTPAFNHSAVGWQKWNHFNLLLQFRIQALIYGHKIKLPKKKKKGRFSESLYIWIFQIIKQYWDKMVHCSYSIVSSLVWTKGYGYKEYVSKIQGRKDRDAAVSIRHTHSVSHAM